MISKTVGIADLQRRTKHYLKEIRRSKQPFMVMSRTESRAVLVDVDAYHRMQRELIRYREEARIVREVQKAEREIADGRAITGNLEQILRRL